MNSNDSLKKKQQILSQLTSIAIKAISIGILLMILIESYYILFIDTITIFDIFINISLTIIVFFVATAYLLHELEKMKKDVLESHEIINTLINTLEQKIADKTQRIQQLLKQKDNFIIQLGHDLKHPINPLINLLPLLIKHEKEEKYKEMLIVLERNTHYINNLVTKTIELGQLNSKNFSLDIETKNLKDIIDEVVDTNSLMFKKNKVKINSYIDETIDIDVDILYIQEVFNNIFSNVIKYSTEPCELNISATIEGSFIQVSIKDNGIGMTDEQLNDIFTEFYKADPSRHDFNSTGLGLNICKRIIEKHGGKIWVESEGLGKGSTFYLHLPFAQKNSSTRNDIYREIDKIIESSNKE